MSFFKPTTQKDLLIHLAVFIGSVALIVILLFYVWLPVTTNHGETITVPDIQGMTVGELDAFLNKRDLRWEPTVDSSYSPDHPPLTVLRQVPAPNTKVKENRKIYVTLNAESPPKVRMPDLIDKSLKSAMMTLDSYDLELGNVTYVPDEFFNVVVEVRFQGRSVLQGEKIEKGSTISLTVGNGFGNTVFQSPNLIGLEREEAEFAIIGSGLRVGKVQLTSKSMAAFSEVDTLTSEMPEYKNVAAGTVQNQYPRPEQTVRIGDPIDLWVFVPDSVSSTANILDNQ